MYILSFKRKNLRSTEFVFFEINFILRWGDAPDSPESVTATVFALLTHPPSEPIPPPLPTPVSACHGPFSRGNGGRVAQKARIFDGPRLKGCQKSSTRGQERFLL
jgi:hypothetical protein